MTTRRTTRIAGLGSLASAGALCLALVAGTAHADAMLTLNNGSNNITLSDGGTGVINFSCADDPSWCTQGGWLLDFDLAVTQPMLGTATAPDMHLTVAAEGTGTLTITFTDNDLTGVGATQLLTSIGGVIGEGGSVSASSWSSDGTLGTFGPLGPGAISGAQSAAEDLVGPYSLTFSTTLTHSENAMSSLDASIQAPEPGVFALLGAGLLGWLIFARRTRIPGLLLARTRRRRAP